MSVNDPLGVVLFTQGLSFLSLLLTGSYTVYRIIITLTMSLTLLRLIV